MEGGATNWQLADTALFACRVTQQGFCGRVGRVLIYFCIKCGHAFALRTLDGCPKTKGTGQALNARMLGTPLFHFLSYSHSSVSLPPVLTDRRTVCSRWSEYDVHIRLPTPTPTAVPLGRTLHSQTVVRSTGRPDRPERSETAQL